MKKRYKKREKHSILQNIDMIPKSDNADQHLNTHFGLQKFIRSIASRLDCFHIYML